MAALTGWNIQNGACWEGGVGKGGPQCLASFQDPHAALGVRRGASLAEVKRRYRELAKLHHPDRNPADREGAEQRFKAVSHAYVQLLGCRVSGVDALREERRLENEQALEKLLSSRPGVLEDTTRHPAGGDT
ncbi:hypothetical protein EMIHUDRAFT_213214 [Emiliania huxleyi CCMP1516]|uniref:J domain-containing protein n=2 Tax=Emiliania huxleyi TaxID=2903 RepID=A0A0D3INW5_EMIH1|nr:hypothetical protein EMIHUDRAFT_213214 [Emiliania huxleyi CCMP1516]EOD12950.1 hypothetical protein EMIHUDRAFT_213214 [Emiliania huxleyi CCMP1516]|eukprot:XP_005765379.1 hypothetical protein EMIHUDRAFT_213214 [Emiliania huxleyi CCMP1516]